MILADLNFQDTTGANSGAYWLNWLFLGLSIFGFLTNTVNIAVFANQRRFKEIRYKYLLVKSIVNWIYFIFSTMSSFFAFCPGCPSSLTYFAANYSIYVTLYFCSCLSSMRMFLLLALSIRTYKIMNKKSHPSKFYHIWITVTSCIVSLVSYLFIPFGYQIIQIPGTDFYLYTYNSFGGSMVFTVLTIVVVVVFVLLSIIVFAVLNINSLIRLKQWVQRRRANRVVNSQNVLFDTESSNIAAAIARRNEALANVKNSTHDEAVQIKKNLTKTIIISLLFYIIGESAFSILMILILVFPTYFYKFSMLGYILLNISPVFDLFIYYYFNKHFRKVLWSMLKRSKT